MSFDKFIKKWGLIKKISKTYKGFRPIFFIIVEMKFLMDHGYNELN